jgi:hypothetical protein
MPPATKLQNETDGCSGEERRLCPRYRARPVLAGLRTAILRLDSALQNPWQIEKLLCQIPQGERWA